MKSSIVGMEKKESTYPRIMQRTDSGGELVVLFTVDKTGMVVYSTHTDYKVGKYLPCWHLHTFVDFKGKLELEN